VAAEAEVVLLGMLVQPMVHLLRECFLEVSIVFLMVVMVLVVLLMVAGEVQEVQEHLDLVVVMRGMIIIVVEVVELVEDLLLTQVMFPLTKELERQT
jgi:fumarate reductase subunit C